MYINFRLIKRRLVLFIQDLWDVTRKRSRLPGGKRAVFLILCGFEKIYGLCFFISQTLRRLRGGFPIDSCKVIAVGNVTTGGTGKSVVVAFLVEYLGADLCAIVSRGYGRGVAAEKNLVVSDGAQILVDVAHAGDEAAMLARSCGCSVVVGSNRKKSCELLMQHVAQKPRYIVLDDAYQNHQLKKNCEILLLDARAPFDNGHLLPAGRLREKDYHRAHIIMLTHADSVTSSELLDIKQRVLRDFLPSSIMCVKHVIRDVFCANEHKIEQASLRGKRFFVVAGIGSFDNFVTSIRNLGVDIAGVLEFPDHHAYDENDIHYIISLIDEFAVDGIITTAKDWTKLEVFLKKYHENKLHYFFVAPVSIEFLSQQEYSHFISCLHEKLV